MLVVHLLSMLKAALRMAKILRESGTRYYSILQHNDRLGIAYCIGVMSIISNSQIGHGMHAIFVMLSLCVTGNISVS